MHCEGANGGESDAGGGGDGTTTGYHVESAAQAPNIAEAAAHGATGHQHAESGARAPNIGQAVTRERGGRVAASLVASGAWFRRWARLQRRRWGSDDAWHHVAHAALGGVGGALSGLMAAGFFEAADALEGVRRRWVQSASWAFWIALPLGAVAILAATRCCFDGAAGSGIPLLMAELLSAAPRGENVRKRALSPWVAAGKVGMTLLGQLVGLSIGREGPTVQAAATICFSVLEAVWWLAEKGPRWTQTLLEGWREWMRDKGRADEHARLAMLAGGAAGIAGAFNTPLGGVLFAIEEMGPAFYGRATGKMYFIIVAVSTACATWVSGSYSWYTGAVFSGTVASNGQFAYITIIVGVFCGLAGGLWSSALLLGMDVRAALRCPYLIALACGAGIVLTGFWGQGQTYGSGEAESAAIIVPQSLAGTDVVNPSTSFGPLKMIATALSYWAGVPGGLFAPTISAGAGWGRLLFRWILGPLGVAQDAEPVVALYAAAAFFAAVTQSPLTSVAIVQGLITDRRDIIPGLLMAVLIAWTLSRALCPEPVYAALSLAAGSACVPPENYQRSLRALRRRQAEAADGVANNSHDAVSSAAGECELDEASHLPTDIARRLGSFVTS